MATSSAAEHSTVMRYIRCRCGFIVVAWEYNPKNKSPEFNGDLIFENIRKHSKWPWHRVRFTELRT